MIKKMMLAIVLVGGASGVMYGYNFSGDVHWNGPVASDPRPRYNWRAVEHHKEVMNRVHELEAQRAKRRQENAYKAQQAYECLSRALQKGDAKEVKQLIASINQGGSEEMGVRRLIWQRSVEDDNCQLIEYLANYSQGMNQEAPIHNVGCVGAEKTMEAAYRWNPLLHAIEKHRVDVIKILLSHGAQVCIEDFPGRVLCDLDSAKKRAEELGYGDIVQIIEKEIACRQRYMRRLWRSVWGGAITV